MRRMLLAAMVCLVACGGGPAADQTTTTDTPTTTAPTATTQATPTITGDIVILKALSYQGPCTAEGGYDDIETGADVVVKDGDGSTIGVSRLDSGETIIGGNQLPLCAFTFEVELTRTADFYVVEIAGRDGPTYTHADMEAEDWDVSLTLG